MKRVISLLIVFLSLTVLFPSCYYDNVTDVYPYYPYAAPCDTTHVTYSQTIKPIMTANCNICHSTATASAGVITDTYEGLSPIAVSGSLWHAVNQDPGVSPMPQNGNRLSDCDLAKIKTWINAGAPNN